MDGVRGSGDRLPQGYPDHGRASLRDVREVQVTGCRLVHLNDVTCHVLDVDVLWPRRRKAREARSRLIGNGQFPRDDRPRAGEPAKVRQVAHERIEAAGIDGLDECAPVM